MSETTDNFAAAFDELAAQGDNPAPKPADPPIAGDPPAPAAPAEPVAADPVVADPPAPADPVAADPVASVDPPAPAPAPAPVPEPAKPSEDIRQLADLLREQRAPAPAPTPAPAPAAAPEILTAEDKEFLTTYEKDWGDVSRGEALKRRVENSGLVDYVFKEFAKEFLPVREALIALSQRTHRTDLRAEIPDYDSISQEKIVDWVGTQPAYLQTAYNHVIANGTKEEVKHLIDTFKTATGVVQGTPTLSTAPAKRDTELPPAAKQAAASLAPVSSKRSAVIQGVDPSDYDGAFAEFAAKL